MIDFIKKRRLWYSLSIFLLSLGIIFMVKNFWGLNHVFNLGIDFTGGTSITIRFDKSHNDVEYKIRQILESMNLNKASTKSLSIFCASSNPISRASSCAFNRSS